ncbi:hypothetical protein FHS43_000452 [Streptosporangium becharense]|uniref:Uncharacterized protein n=1 Tax=Streptosporangium becharense TaxID=1816182 RepID=A0A7W9MGE6_9ACTN|nr:hypothetical protein [Streptosporangium becharense]MBB2909206.1 hypothetical protein [Streptosporangium becharense]MBB5819775.1 hypothetical protein [Streptosporangium becharense]
MRKMSPRTSAESLPKTPDVPPVEPREFLALVSVDFTGTYQVYLAAKDERIKMTRLSMSLLAAPFAAAIALASSKVVNPVALTTWHSVPWYLFATIAGFGLLSVVPFLRLIEAVNAHMRTARALNNFRLLYAVHLKDHFSALGWTPNLPVDPRYPETYAPLAWPGINVMMLALVNSAYIATGVVGLVGARPDAALLLVIIGLISLVHYFLYYVRANVSRQRRLPHNPFHFPNVET